MKINKKTFALITASTILLQLSTASAAEPGSFFIKGEGGYSIGDSKFKTNGLSGTGGSGSQTSALNSNITVKNLKGFNGGVGFGYIATEDVWSDLTISFNSIKTKKSDTAIKNIATEIKHDTISAMLNGYYGFNTGSKVTPYITAGIGGGRTKTQITIPNTGMLINNVVVKDSSGAIISGTIKSKNSTAFAYQGGFGLSFELMRGIAFDVGYRIGNQVEGKFKNIPALQNSNVGLKITTPMKHTILGGIKIGF